MNDAYNIDINFLELESKQLDIQIYRRESFSSSEQCPPGKLWSKYKLPINPSDTSKLAYYWVSTNYEEHFEKATVYQDVNNWLTNSFMLFALQSSIQRNIPADDYFFSKGRISKWASIAMIHHPEGKEELNIRPYFLQATQQYGFLVNFHFRRAAGEHAPRQIQRLSLSLDRTGRRNLNYYNDRYNKLNSFLERASPVLEDLRLPISGDRVVVGKRFASIASQKLGLKAYLFANNALANAQYQGLKLNGPFQQPSAAPHLLFVFQEANRIPARRLAMLLSGQLPQLQAPFPGFENLFRLPLTIDRDPMIVGDFGVDSATALAGRIKGLNRIGTVPVLVLPSKDERPYYTQKAVLAKLGIASQACTLDVLRDETVLKWSVANIALQIYCKAGGIPWKVRASGPSTLIIGISQAHKERLIEGKRDIEKFMAFSVLTDNSGMFRSIQALGSDTSEPTYLTKLQASLKRVLEENAGVVDRIVIHTSFRLKHLEIRAIKDTVRQCQTEAAFQKCLIAVIKINQKNDFFGINRNINSFVPFEGTYTSLGGGEYLMWFEGISPGDRTVRRLVAGPAHVYLYNHEEIEPQLRIELLQDLANLSGANWRGFNARNEPVSVYYCHIIAEMVREFYNYNLPIPEVDHLAPWFL